MKLTDMLTKHCQQNSLNFNDFVPFAVSAAGLSYAHQKPWKVLVQANAQYAGQITYCGQHSLSI